MKKQRQMNVKTAVDVRSEERKGDLEVEEQRNRNNDGLCDQESK